MKIGIMTVDLEPDLRSHNCKSMELVLPKLLNFFDDHRITATFFTVTSLLEKYESVIKDISRKQEVASHSHTHSWLNETNAEFEIRESKQKLEEYGMKCAGFRAPKFITTSNHLELLAKYGYEYDSSTNSLTFRVAHDNIYQFKCPAINSGLTYRKLLYPFSKAFPRPKMFYLHPWEFLEKKDLPSSSLMKTLLRQNCGDKAVKIFKNIVERSDRRWMGCKKYLDTQPFP